MTFTKPVLKSQRKTTVYNFPKMVFGDPSGRPYGQRFVMTNVTVTIIGDIKGLESLGCYHYNTEGSLVDDFRELSSLEE